ncbi:MAG TPA: DUF4145 domain-containing protein [Anaerolineales bacterium]|nr:DUF4145 domain-containing protein [Anaerolineales bacterium]
MDIEDNLRREYGDYFQCGICQTFSEYEILFAKSYEEYHYDDEGTKGQGFAIIQCQKCESLSLLTIKISGELRFESLLNEEDLNEFLRDNPDILNTEFSFYSADKFDDGAQPFYALCMSILGQYPFGLSVSKDVPDQIKLDIQESFNCLAIGAVNASVIMSRRVIQQIAINFGVKEDKFLGKALNELKEKNIINNELHEALIEVKNWGDGGAHPGKIQNILPEDAKKVADLMLFLVNYIYPTKRDPSPMVEELKKIRQGKSPKK